MHVALSVSDKLEQSGKTRPCCVITNWHEYVQTGRLSASTVGRWWVLDVCLLVCDKKTPPGSVIPPAFPKALNPTLSGFYSALPNNCPFITLQSVYQRECVFKYARVHNCGPAAARVKRIITLSYVRSTALSDSPLSWLLSFPLKFIFLMFTCQLLCLCLHLSINLSSNSISSSICEIPPSLPLSFTLPLSPPLTPTSSFCC